MNTTATFALPIPSCNRLGEQFAAEGWDVARIREWLAANGYSTDGTTAVRIIRAHREQLARNDA